jgi:predicted PurR-regulated permease PerM
MSDEHPTSEEEPTAVHDRLESSDPPAPHHTEEELDAAVASTGRSSEPVVIARWVQLVSLPLLLVMLWALARSAGSVLLVFLAAAIGAMILNPLVTMLRRAHVPRGLAVLLVFVAFLALFGLAGYLLANPIVDQVQKFQKDVPHIIDSANKNLADLQKYFNDNGIHVEIKKQGQTALQTLEQKVAGGAGDVVSFGGDLLSSVVTAGFNLILTFVVMVYMLLYGERIGDWIRRFLPRGSGEAEDDFPLRVQHAVTGYVRGQLLFSLLMGAGATIGLYIFGLVGIFPPGKQYAVAFGIFFGVMELIPYVGPVLGAIPPVLVALFQDPLSAVWVVLLFVALQQLEGHIVAPQVFGRTLRINPLLVIFALLIGNELYGLVGALLALPIAAVIRETVDYLRGHTVLEPWGTPSPAALAGAYSPKETGGPVSHCPSCGAAAVVEGDAYCRSCGAPQDRPSEAAAP